MSGRASRSTRQRRRAPRVAFALLAALACAASSSVASATAAVALDLDTMLSRSVDAFFGEVRAVRSEAFEGEPWTVVTITVERWLRSGGSPVDDASDELDRRPDVELAFLGGDAPGVARRSVAGMPTLTLGERVLLLSYGVETRYASNLVGFDQGLFRLVDDAWTDDDGRTLGLGADGILELGVGASTASANDVLDAVIARLSQVGVAP
ncbi:hypothetical protein BH23DEI1_BH23DEI1_13290 [soil metagenome]